MLNETEFVYPWNEAQREQHFIAQQTKHRPLIGVIRRGVATGCRRLTAPVVAECEALVPLSVQPQHHVRGWFVSRYLDIFKPVLYFSLFFLRCCLIIGERGVRERGIEKERERGG